MKRLLSLVAAPSLGALLAATPLLVDPHEESPAELAVKAAVQDYVEAIYRAQPERMERSLHPSLDKRGFYRAPDAADYGTPRLMSYESLVDLASWWNAEGERTDLEYEIRVHAVMDKTASAWLSADWGVDHMHLENVDGTWRIIQVLWQSHPTPEADGE